VSHDCFVPLINWRSMCGRYRLTAKERYIGDHFGLDEDPPWTPRWNIAPTQQIATIRQHRSEPKRIFGLMRWGLIPYWAKEPSIGLKTINAMSETAAEKPAFRDAMRWRRCLIPADGFYEWKKFGPKEKQAYNFGMADDSRFAFAGLWDRWLDQDNKAIGNVHDTYDKAKLAGRRCTRSDACDAKTRGLRSLAGSGHYRFPACHENDDQECAREIAIPVTAPRLF
jgi:SOS response associated peptidase (SRAP)